MSKTVIVLFRLSRKKNIGFFALLLITFFPFEMCINICFILTFLKHFVIQICFFSLECTCSTMYIIYVCLVILVLCSMGNVWFSFCFHMKTNLLRRKICLKIFWSMSEVEHDTMIRAVQSSGIFSWNNYELSFGHDFDFEVSSVSIC